jgi:hypothetical protein
LDAISVFEASSPAASVVDRIEVDDHAIKIVGNKACGVLLHRVHRSIRS